MSPRASVVVEFFGMARRHAGRPALGVYASTVAEALDEASRACPTMKPFVHEGRLSPHYLASINAGPFLDDLGASLSAGDRVLILSADSGG